MNILQVLFQKKFLKSITSRDYFKYIINLKIQLLKLIPKTITVQNFNFKIFFNINYIKFKLFNINNNLLDTVSNYNSKVQLLLPLLIKSNKYNKYYIINIILLEFPLINTNNILILNGVQRILLSKLTRNEGLYYNKFLKEDYFIYQIQILSHIYFGPISITLDINTFNILIKFEYLNFSINLIILLYLLGINYNYINSYSNYGNTIIMNNLLHTSIYSYLNLYKKNLKIFKNILIIFKKIIFTTTLGMFKIFIKNSLYFNFIYIIDNLLNISFNKTFLKDSDHFENKLINSFENTFKDFIKIKILQFLNFVSLIDIHKFIINNNILKLKLLIENNSLLYKENLLINPLLRILDDTNIISEFSSSLKILNSNIITISSINTVSIQLRDVRLSQLGKFCIINTSEGPSSGLVLALTLNTFNVTNKYLKSFFNISGYNKNFENNINLDIKEQEVYYIILEELPLKKEILFNTFIISNITKSTFNTSNINFSNIVYAKLENFISASENLIPFIFNNEPARCLMGAKMQTQSIPLLYKNHSLILSGYEYSINTLYSETLRALQDGIVSYISFYKIIVQDLLNREIIYYLPTYINSNTKIIKYQKPIVWVGERITIGQLLTENCSSKEDLLTLGNPSLVMYGSYFGYDYEDAIIIAQNIIYNNIYTSLHIDIYENEFNYNEFILEYSTLNIPECNLFNQRNLNILGIIKEGSKIIEGDILISKLLKKEVLLNIINNNILYLIINIFGTDLLNNINISEVVSKGNSGRVLKVELFLYKNYLKFRIFIGKIRVLELGDKLCGRHGNKGIISYISKNIDLPYTITGEFPNIITGSLGVPSRMNLGQLYEGLLGISCFYLNTKIVISYLINNIVGNNYLKLLLYDLLYKSSIKTSFNKVYNLYTPGKINIRDGRSGFLIQGTVCFGVLQYYKLIHMIKDKINYRTTGKYFNITQQPIRGRSGGGQRFGEMEIWALEAFGVAYTIRELLSFRSDDMIARKNITQTIISGNDIITSTTVSETLKITIKELQSLSINIDMFIIYPDFNEIKLNSKIF